MLIKKIAVFIFLTFIASSFILAQDTNILTQDKQDSSTAVTGKKVEDGVIYGNDLNKELQPVMLSELITNPGNYEGKTISVSGTVTDVCQRMGCWMKISDGTNEIMVQTLHKFFMPKDIAGGRAVAEGTFKVTEISEEHAKEMMKESIKTDAKPEDIKGPQKVYVIQATGVKILYK